MLSSMRGQVNESRGVVESRGSILSGLAPGCKRRDGAGKQIEKHGNNVHKLRSSDFIGAWIGSCQERREGVKTSVRAPLSPAIAGMAKGLTEI
jgi:hypothetical protein